MSKLYKSFIVMVFIFTVFNLTLLAAPAPQAEVDCADTTVVQAGDWLSKIADKYYGDVLAYPAIMEATNAKQASDDSFASVANADLIEIGWKLCLPATANGSPVINSGSVALPADSTANGSATLPDSTTTPPTYKAEVATHFSLFQSVQPIPLLTSTYPEFSYDEAYTFQESLAATFISNGNQQIGYKLGLTGEAKPFGAEEAIYGRLFQSMQTENGAIIETSAYVNPRYEVELAFMIGSDVSYPITTESLQEAVSGVAPAVELPDLVFADLPNLSWLDVIADNVAPRQIIVGEMQSLTDLNVNEIAVQATLNGEVVAEGVGSNSMGDQWVALAFLAEKLNERGEQLKAGDIIMTGSLTPMLPLEAGAYEVTYGDLGRLRFVVIE